RIERPEFTGPPRAVTVWIQVHSLDGPEDRIGIAVRRKAQSRTGILGNHGGMGHWRSTEQPVSHFESLDEVRICTVVKKTVPIDWRFEVTRNLVSVGKLVHYTLDDLVVVIRIVFPHVVPI